jgi:Tol biopolymer transport system component
VSIGSDGSQGNGASRFPAISADGRYVAFGSRASNLIPGDTNGREDIFLRDTQSGVTSRVNVANDGSQGGGSDFPVVELSPHARYVVFQDAGRLVPEDTNGSADVFVRDRESGVTERVSVADDGSQANGDSEGGQLSADGHYVVFASSARNLVSGDTNFARDVFVRDRVAGVTTRVSVASNGSQATRDSDVAGISADGRYVLFSSDAPNLVRGDTNDAVDAFVRDTRRNVTIRVSVTNAGRQANHGSSWANGISGDGRYAVFSSLASNLVIGDTNSQDDMFVRDRQTATTIRVSLANNGHQANSESSAGEISGDGRFVIFSSFADNLVRGDTNRTYDVFIRGPLSEVCQAPDLKGKTVTEARTLLVARRCALGSVTKAYSNKARKGRIISQSPPAGARVPARTKVNVIVSRGRRP